MVKLGRLNQRWHVDGACGGLHGPRARSGHPGFRPWSGGTLFFSWHYRLLVIQVEVTVVLYLSPKFNLVKAGDKSPLNASINNAQSRIPWFFSFFLKSREVVKKAYQ